jgi:transcriptional regulator with XRE-family HTH domain
MVDPAWFGPRLKELREGAGMSQPALAERAGLKKAGIANLEQGRTRPHWDTVVALCQALEVSADQFMRPPAPREATGRGRPRKAAADVPPEETEYGQEGTARGKKPIRKRG